MKTTIYSIRIVGTLLTIVAVLACCNSVWALGESSGGFVLPFDVQWNGATLPAGQYDFTLSSGQLGGVLHVRDGRQHRNMLVVAVALGETPNHSALTIVSSVPTMRIEWIVVFINHLSCGWTAFK